MLNKTISEMRHLILAQMTAKTTEFDEDLLTVKYALELVQN